MPGPVLPATQPVVQDISGLTEGSYSVTVTDDYGCQADIDTVLTLTAAIDH